MKNNKNDKSHYKLRKMKHQWNITENTLEFHANQDQQEKTIKIDEEQWNSLEHNYTIKAMKRMATFENHGNH